MGLSTFNWRAWLCLLLQSRSAQCLSERKLADAEPRN